ncbi:MAG: YciI family protein [Pseudomonadota bacterium]|jgi:uncharacterized protein YciI
MFIVTLRFGANKARATEFMPQHNDWIQRGFEDGVFALVGSLQPNAGGAILAHGATRSELEERIKADPFVAHGIVSADIMEIRTSRADERLQFLAQA